MGLPVRDITVSLNRPNGGVIIAADEDDINEFMPKALARTVACRPGGGGVENGPGVVKGCFSTCNALITTASRL